MIFFVCFFVVCKGYQHTTIVAARKDRSLDDRRVIYVLYMLAECLNVITSCTSAELGKIDRSNVF